MEHTAQRLDTLERSLSQLQKRYDQVRTMMGGDAPADGEHTAGAAAGFVPAPAIQTRAPGHATARTAVRATVTDAPSDGGAASDGIGSEAAADSGVVATPPGAGAATAAPAAHRGRARGAAATAAPQSVVVPPPPDSGTAPSPQAEPQ